MNLSYRMKIALLVVCGTLLQSGKADADERKSEAAAVSLQAGTWKDVQKIVSSSSGKIVVVDVWSTSCLPCMKEFPGLVSLHREFPDDVVCISFNVDYVGIRNKPAEFYRNRVAGFLEKQQAGFSNILCTEESDAFFAAENLSSIPAVYVYGRDGKLAKRFDDTLLEDGKEEAFTYSADVTPMVRKLVKQ
jgi:thiol-disulfide isomerase/thioredoxin